MGRFDDDFYDEDKKYLVRMFAGEVVIPFQATRKEIDGIFRLHSRPKWLRPRNFGVTAENGNLLLKIDLTKVVVIEAKELNVGLMATLNNQIKENSTNEPAE